jgi:hypothetical protein
MRKTNISVNAQFATCAATDAGRSSASELLARYIERAPRSAASWPRFPAQALRWGTR